MDRRRYLVTVTAAVGALSGCGGGGEGNGGGAGDSTAADEELTATVTPTATPNEATRQAIQAAVEALSEAFSLLTQAAEQFQGYQMDVTFDPEPVRQDLGEADGAIEEAAASVASERGRTVVDALRETANFIGSLTDLIETMAQAATQTQQAIEVIGSGEITEETVAAVEGAHEDFGHARESVGALQSSVPELHPEAVAEIMESDPEQLEAGLGELAAYLDTFVVYTGGVQHLVVGSREFGRALEALQANEFDQSLTSWQAAQEAATRAREAFEDGKPEVDEDARPVIATLARTAAVLSPLGGTMAHVTVVLDHLDLADEYREAEEFDQAAEELTAAGEPLAQAESTFETLMTRREELSAEEFREVRIFHYSDVIDGTRVPEHYLSALRVLVPGVRAYFQGRHLTDGAITVYGEEDFESARDQFASAHEEFEAARAELAGQSFEEEVPSNLQSAVLRYACRSRFYREATSHAQAAAQAVLDGDLDRHNEMEEATEEALQQLDSCPS